MMTKKDDEIQIKFANLNKELDNLDKLSINELKYLYNNYYFNKKNYLNYILKNKKRLRIITLFKFLYLLLLSIIINLLSILIPEIALLFVFTLVGLYEMSIIDEINEILAKKKYNEIIKVISNYISNYIEKAQKSEIEHKENAVIKELDKTITYDYKQDKEIKLVRILTKGDEK